ncbi:MAG: alpha/beta fold hydrolase [Nocardioidaceae bacterium]
MQPGRMITRLDVDEPEALILMLHGGKADSHQPVDDRSASWRRAGWMMSQISGRAHEAGVGVWLLRYGVRGWNHRSASPPSPVPDALWALDEVRRAHGAGLPVVLLGHSMGARTAVAVADHPSVTGVVALAPWLPATDDVAPLRGRRLAAAHGRSDKITSSRQTRAFCARAETVAASVEFRDMGRVGHYMFRGIPAWNDFAVSRALAFARAPIGRPGGADRADGHATAHEHCGADRDC